MHLELFRHSIRPIQTSWLPEPMRRGPCFMLFLIFSPTDPSLSIMFPELLVYHPLFYSFLLSIYMSGSAPSTNLDISLITPSTSYSQTKTSHITPCCLSIAAAITPEASWAAI